MDKRNFNSIGDEIKDIVQNAVNSKDFHHLNNNIRNTVGGALDEVRRALGPNQGSRRTWNKPFDPPPPWNHNNDNQRRKYSAYDSKVPNNSRTYNNSQPSNRVRPTPIPKTCVPVGRISGTLLTIFGSVGVGILGVAVVTLSILGSAIQDNKVFSYIVLGLLPFLMGSVLMSMKGSRIRKRLKRFQQYVNLLHGRNYCMMKEITSNMGLSTKYIVKDLQKMISIGMFPDGHIDEQKTCFMLNNESYMQYLKTQESLRLRHLEEEKNKLNQEKTEQTEQNAQANKLSAEVRKAIDEGRRYIRQIKEANDEIPGEEISKKLDRLEKVTSKIFDYIEIHPEQLSEIQKFMDYYLPTTLKLLNAYKELDNQYVQGDNITTAKTEIEGTLDTINLAFENLLDSLFEDVAMDISTDISVLETMLAQEGLTEKDFN